MGSQSYEILKWLYKRVFPETQIEKPRGSPIGKVTWILHEYQYTNIVTSEYYEIYKIDTLILTFFKSIHRKRGIGPRPNEA